MQLDQLVTETRALLSTIYSARFFDQIMNTIDISSDLKAVMTKSIGEYIKLKRQSLGLSQEALAEKLRLFDPIFTDIDALTISRWERQKTTPSILRQVILIELFGDNPSELLQQTDFAIGLKESVVGLDKLFDNYFGHNHLFGAHPYLNAQQENCIPIVGNNKRNAHLASAVCAYMHNLSHGRVNWPVATLQSLMDHPTATVIAYYQNNILIGHLIALNLTEAAYQQFLNSEITEEQLGEEQLVSDLNEKHCTLILSNYVGHRQLAHQYFSFVITTLLKHPQCQSLGGHLRTDFGFKLAELLNGEVLGHGLCTGSMKQGGVKYQGKRYEHLFCSIDRRKMLSRPATINLLRSVSQNSFLPHS